MKLQNRYRRANYGVKEKNSGSGRILPAGVVHGFCSFLKNHSYEKNE
jgi:hypothetical protein